VILDTNSLSAFADGLPVAVSAVHVISLGEFRFGIAQSRHRVDYEHWLRQNLPFYGILDIDRDTAAA